MRQWDYYAPQRPARVAPLVQGCEIGVPAHTHGPVVRRYWSVYYVAAGRGEYELDGVVHVVRPGSIFVIMPGRKIRYSGDAEQPWDLIWVGFSLRGEAPAALKEPVVSCSAARRIFEEMRAYSGTTGSRINFLTGKLYELFALLEDHSSPQQPSYVEQAIACMKAEYMLNLSVSGIAERLGLNRSYFSMLFRAEKGVSPGKYLNHLRMENAAHLLCTEKLPLSAVARACGYADPAVFTRTFRKHFGVCPRQYRVQNRK